VTKQSVDSWVAVAEASGTASADEIEDVTRMAISQSAPDVALGRRSGPLLSLSQQKAIRFSADVDKLPPTSWVPKQSAHRQERRFDDNMVMCRSGTWAPTGSPCSHRCPWLCRSLFRR
jgi:hypothetical protein